MTKAGNRLIAAAENARLIAERDRLRDALKPFAAIPDPTNPNAWLPEHPVWGRNGVVITVGDFAEARAAIASLRPAQDKADD